MSGFCTFLMFSYLNILAGICTFCIIFVNSQPRVLERKCICLSSSVANNFYQFGLLDFNHIQVSIAYNFC